MTKILAFLIKLFIVLLLNSPVYPPQDHNTNKLISSEVSWTERGLSWEGIATSYRYTFSEEPVTFGNNQQYHELLKSDVETGGGYEKTGRFFREEDQKVYEYYQNREFILYDFSLESGQNIEIEDPVSGYEVLLSASSHHQDSIVLLNGEKRKVIGLDCEGHQPAGIKWIEGIGSLDGFLSSYLSCAFDINSTLQCFYINDELVYMNPESGECWTVSSKHVHLNDFKVWPNPGSDIVRIEAPVEFDRIRIYSIVIGYSHKVEVYNKTLNISGLPGGIYVLEFEKYGEIIGRNKLIKK